MMLLPAKMNSFNGKQGQVPGWMTIVGTFFFFFSPKGKASRSLIPMFGVLLMIHLLVVTAQLS